MAIATDCKSVRVSVRWFESTFPHAKARLRLRFFCVIPSFFKKSRPFCRNIKIFVYLCTINKHFMKIFVAKLAFKTTAEDLRALFEQFGEVESCKVIMDHETGRSKCYGFVEMPNDDEAYKAIVETDETIFMGNELQVKKSRPQPATPPKPEKPARPRRPHHPYVPPVQEE